MASISPINVTTSRLCLQFTLVDGATTDTVDVTLENSAARISYTLSTNDNELVFTRCIHVLLNLWRLSSCDGDHVTCPNPAITTTIEILPHDTGTVSTVPPIPTTTTVPTSSSTGTVNIIVPNMSLYSIVSTPSNTPTIPTANNRGWVRVYVLGGVMAIVVIMYWVCHITVLCFILYII